MVGADHGATRCQILRLKCTKFDFCWGSAPDPSEGAYSAPPGPLVVFKGPTSKGREGKGERKGRGWKGKRRVGNGKGAGGWTPIGESGSASESKASYK